MEGLWVGFFSVHLVLLSALTHQQYTFNLRRKKMATTFNLTVTLEAEDSGTVVGKISEALTDTACDEFTGQQYMEITTGSSNVAMSLGPLTTAYSVAIVSDQVITIKVNGSSDALTLRANEPIVLPTVTSLTVSNASGSTAKVQYIAVGT
jgi:hypothetical protein